MTGKAFIYLIITLLIGFALGMFSDGLLHLRRMRKPERIEPLYMMEQRLVHELQLTGKQQQEISNILDAYEKKSMETRKAIRKKAEADFDSLRMSLIPYLTDEQVKKLNDLHKLPPLGPRPGMFPDRNPTFQDSLSPHHDRARLHSPGSPQDSLHRYPPARR